MNVAIGFVDGVENQAVAHEAAIHEDVDAIAIGALDFRARGEPVEGEARFFFTLLQLGLGDGSAKGGADYGNFDQLVEGLLAEKLVDALGEALDRRAVDDLLRGRGENELLAGISKRVMGEQRGDVAQLGRFGFEELAARASAIEKIGGNDGGACGKTGGVYADEVAARKFHARALRLFFRARFPGQAGDGGDGWEGLSAR